MQVSLAAPVIVIGYTMHAYGSYQDCSYSGSAGDYYCKGGDKNEGTYDSRRLVNTLLVDLSALFSLFVHFKAMKPAMAHYQFYQSP